MKLGDVFVNEILSICFYKNFVYMEVLIEDNNDKDILRHNVIRVQGVENKPFGEVHYLNKEKSQYKTKESWLVKIEEINNFIKS